ncbi:MAG: DUF982 domain-containing protein [Rhizobium altiplani]|jgi:hypothetical protein|uniref:DUF982 domain-containing protein n=1 Tax=Rhizobium altiplani TaxID=1864509 RepID=UPI000DD8E583
MLSTSDWTFGLEIWLPDFPQPIDIKGTGEASALLADKWPVTFGPAFERALAVCAAVMEGLLPADDAKLALIDAAEEVGISWMDRIYYVPDRSDGLTKSPPAGQVH